jgi:hypothetical protein
MAEWKRYFTTQVLAVIRQAGNPAALGAADYQKPRFGNAFVGMEPRTVYRGDSIRSETAPGWLQFLLAAMTARMALIASSIRRTASRLLFSSSRARARTASSSRASRARSMLKA